MKLTSDWRNISERGVRRRAPFDWSVLVCLVLGAVIVAGGWWVGRTWIQWAAAERAAQQPVAPRTPAAGEGAGEATTQWPELLEASVLPAGYAAKRYPAWGTRATAPLLIERETPPRFDQPGAEAGASDLERLRRRRLTIPVRGVDRGELWDSFSDSRGSRSHRAIDIMAPRGRPVLATEDGIVAKVFQSRLGGRAIYQYGSEGRYTYYYAHLDRFAESLEAGDPVRRGQVIGYVGSTGNASDDAPHLHFAIYRMLSKGRWWRGAAINPYLVLTAPG